MKRYFPKEIEAKWQKIWQEEGLYQNYSRPNKFYTLDMFPYPSGAGLHVGHPKGYIATDVSARYKMLKGFSVLHPMGWDAFGLPAENYALEHKVHPRVAVQKNITTFKKQLEMFGFTYDWDREINTTDTSYYKWTQWIFLKMYEKGLAYESEEPVHWCPHCKTVLALEDLEKGRCERCETPVIQRRLRQWVLKMTAYADRLLYDLDTENLDWEESIIEQQRNWIGRSEGVEFQMAIKDSKEKIEAYTTRIDTVFGMTYAVVAPEHPVIEKLKNQIQNSTEVEAYIKKAQNKTELERTELQKKKIGVELKGVKVINPFNNREIPLFVADYILGFYGTGAIMAVPAHDERDFEFAKEYGLEIIEVVRSIDQTSQKLFTGEGILINSGEYNSLTTKEAKVKMAKWLKDKGLGQEKVNYKMRDWVFSRQRYWGEPIPVVHCEKCGTVGVPEAELPIKLPEVEKYEPTGTGEGPLAGIKSWVNTTCPKCDGPAKRETNTMPQWAGSSWYYLRYIDPHNEQKLIDPKKEKEWMPVDLYVGGAEHATRHLLYARFWHKFLYDLRVVSTKEPFQKLVHVGLINGEDGKKMSKRFGNVVNPDDIINEYGADALRVFEMFMGPFTQNISWSTAGVIGTYKFLEKVWKLSEKVVDRLVLDKEIKILLNQTIKKVGEDIEGFRFNTAISALMILANKFEQEAKINKSDYQNFLLLLAPFAPHITEELWQNLGNKQSIFVEKWPEYDPNFLVSEIVTIAVQINGKTRGTVDIASSRIDDQKVVEEEVGKNEKLQKHLAIAKVRKVIYVEGKIINYVTG